MQSAIFRVTFALMLSAIVSIVSSCNTEPPVNPNPPLASTFFFSGPVGYRYVYLSSESTYSNKDSLISRYTDTVTYRKSGLDTNRALGRNVYEVSVARNKSDYIETFNYTFDNDEFTQWIEIGGSQQRYVKYNHLVNPVREGTVFTRVDGYPQQARITATDRSYRTPTGVFPGVEVTVTADTTGNTAIYVTIEQKYVYSQGNGHLYMTQRSIRRHPNPDSVQTIISEEQLIGIYSK